MTTPRKNYSPLYSDKPLKVELDLKPGDSVVLLGPLKARNGVEVPMGTVCPVVSRKSLYKRVRDDLQRWRYYVESPQGRFYVLDSTIMPLEEYVRRTLAS